MKEQPFKQDDLVLVNKLKLLGFTTLEIRRIRTMQPAVQEKFINSLPADFREKYLDPSRKLANTTGVRLTRLKQWLSPLGEEAIEKLAFIMKPNSDRLSY